MKKVTLSFLTLLYFMLSTGFAVDIHYCMGKKLGAALHWQDNEKCKRCGMTEKKGGCCSEETKFFKLDLKFKSPTAAYKIPLLLSPADLVLLPYNFDGLLVLASPKKSYIKIEAPDLDAPPIYIRNCNFRL